MRRMDCSFCGCAKSEHKRQVCMTCLETYRDNYKEYQKSYKGDPENYVSPWHDYKLDNLKYLEQIYESRKS